MVDVIKHIGTPRHSGRYPWGSGKDGYQRNTDFLGTVEKLKAQGLSNNEIAKGMGLSSTEFRARRTIELARRRKEDRAMALRLKDKGYSNVKIGERMGINESSVRSLLDPALAERSSVVENISNALETAVNEKKYIDVGAGSEIYLGVSRTKMDASIALLKEKGYTLNTVKVRQVGTGKYTRMKILTRPDVEYKELLANKDKIGMVPGYSDDGGKTIIPIKPPRQISAGRVLVRYAEEGGADKDGVIELRRGVEDISLGNSHYSQVRIGVDGTHYLKGMAVYGDIPKGYDIVFNTNKHIGTPFGDVLKKVEADPDRPFGAVVRQKEYIDANGNKQLSALNIVNDEGTWASWSRNISSQVLSKQLPSLAKRQLGLAFDIKKEEFDELTSLTNPAVKRRLLESFADDCDAAAEHLKAAALPRQASHVILPVPSMKENEVFAPGYNDGDNVVLIRHPHGGTFEIPELIVNNKNPEAIKVISKGAIDAVGIHPNVAKRLSGADFDGDAVIVIPNKKGWIKTTPAIKALQDFDPREAYKLPDSAPKMKSETKELEMGKVSNLITDMTIKGASRDEITRAVKHSMVVIDAEKHHLDYKKSYEDQGIATLKEKYQGKASGGAATIISRASSEKRVLARKEYVKIDPVTGEKIYQLSGETYVNKEGKTVPRTFKSTKMAETKDAFKLSSGTPMENIYAEHANKLKALANLSRKTAVNTPPLVYSRKAKEVYSKEVASLNAKLSLAKRNKPLERKAQLLANKEVAMKKSSNPAMDKKTLKKVRGVALDKARNRTGAKKDIISEITDKEWEAIQAGAISNHALTQILLNTDLGALKQRSMPRSSKALSPARVARAKAMLAEGNTVGDVASVLGVSPSTISDAVNQ